MILVPQPGIELGFSAVRVWSPNLGTAREFPPFHLLYPFVCQQILKFQVLTSRGILIWPRRHSTVLVPRTPWALPSPSAFLPFPHSVTPVPSFTLVFSIPSSQLPFLCSQEGNHEQVRNNSFHCFFIAMQHVSYLVFTCICKNDEDWRDSSGRIFGKWERDGK